MPRSYGNCVVCGVRTHRPGYMCGSCSSKKRESEKEIGPVQKLVVMLLQDQGPMTRHEIKEMLNTTPERVRMMTMSLERRNKIYNKNGIYQVVKDGD